MSEAPSTDAARTRSGACPPGTAVYRYFFYGWLFRDAQRGSLFERAAALRHNRDRARWLPTYLRRWFVAGLLLAGIEVWTEQASVHAVVSATFAVALILVVVFLVVTALCWAMLRRPSPG